MSAVRLGRCTAGAAAAARLACGALCALGALATTASAQRAGKPRLDSGRVAVEAIGGAYAGIGGFLVGRYAGETVGAALGVESEITRRRVGQLAGATTGTFATAGFVYVVGSMGDTAGDFDDTLLGAGAGLLVGYAVGKMIFPAEGASAMSSKARWATINILALLPSIGATVGFNSTRRFD